ncbi:MAG: hypothetical protein ACKO8I_15305 [Cyanobacteriota bacterium]
MDGKIWLDLERLDGLALEPANRAILWRELLLLLGSGADADANRGSSKLIPALRRRLFLDELEKCRNQCRAGEWLGAGRSLEALHAQAPSLGESNLLVERLIELLELLHQQLIGSDEREDGEQRPELLWQAHRWLQMVEGLCGSRSEHRSSIREEICRHGAIAWLARLHQVSDMRERLLALQRSQTLLLHLAELHDPCPLWVSMGLREGLQLALLQDGEAAPLPEELLRWALGYARHALPADAQQASEELLWPAVAAMEVGQALKLPFFSPR